MIVGMRNIFTKTLYDLRWMMLTFGLGMGTLAGFVIYIYPFVSDATGGLLTGVDRDLVIALLGDEALRGTPQGYLRLQLIPFQPLYLSVFLIITTSAAIAGEADAKTLALLLARPVSRSRVLAEKTLAILLAMVMILVLTALGAVSGARLANVDIPLFDLALMVLMTLPFGMWLLGFGLCCSAVFHTRLLASLVATAVVVFSYMFNSSTEFVLALRAYNRLVPFNYYAWGQPLIAPIDWESAMTLVIAGVVFFALGLVAFDRRDVDG